MGIKLAEDTISAEDIQALCEWLPKAKKLTQGDLVLEFEQQFSNIIGSNATFVNSGSSALLLAFWSLIECGRLKRGDKVAIPAICWSTDLAPLIQFGLEPVVIDVNYEYGMSYENLLDELSRNNIKCILYVYVLGLAAEAEKIIKLCREKNILLVEDCCESLGTKLNKSDGYPVGSYGDISVFSTFYSHHISTIEGGFVCSNREDIYRKIRETRNHGWVREEYWRKEYQEEWNIPDFNMNYTFFSAGFNVRNTEIAAFIGLRQIDRIRLANMLEIRYNNYITWEYACFGRMKPYDSPFEPVFGLPFTTLYLDNIKIIEELKKNDIECRPMIAGNIINQPVYKKYFGYKYLPIAEHIHSTSIYLPNHHKVTRENVLEMSKVCKK